MKKFLIFLLFFAILGAVYSSYAQETMTLTTFYPSPIGAYDRLRLVPRAQLNAADCNEAAEVGTIYYDSTNDEFSVCMDDGTGTIGWGPVAAGPGGGIWKRVDGGTPFIHPDTSTDNVVIGAAAPLDVANQKSLEVGGLVKFYNPANPGSFMMFDYSWGNSAAITLTDYRGDNFLWLGAYDNNYGNLLYSMDDRLGTNPQGFGIGSNHMEAIPRFVVSAEAMMLGYNITAGDGEWRGGSWVEGAGNLWARGSLGLGPAPGLVNNTTFNPSLPERLTLYDGNIALQNSPKGIRLNSADRPLITRGFDPFTAAAPADFQGVGRWGLFMEPHIITLGFPNIGTDAVATGGVAGTDKKAQIVAWNENHTKYPILTAMYNGNVGIGTETPTAELEVNGGAVVTSLAAQDHISTSATFTSELTAQEGIIDNITTQKVTAEDGLTLNIPKFTMQNSDGTRICDVQILSTAALPDAAGSFSIVCNSAAAGCGNFIIEPGLGEDCDPPNDLYVKFEEDPAIVAANCPGCATADRVIFDCDASCHYSVNKCQYETRCCSSPLIMKCSTVWYEWNNCPCCGGECTGPGP